MSVNTNKIDGANSEITATIEAKDLEASIEKIAKKLSKDAKVDGFRKGKVPMAVVKKQYGDRIKEDAESEALRDIVDEGLKTLGLANSDLIGEPQVTKFDREGDKIDVAITISNRPQFELGDYSKLIPAVKKPKVTKKAITERLKELAESQAEFIDVEGRAIVDGDTVVFDFDGYIDGEAFPGGKAEDFSLKIGSGQFIPGFEEQMIGLNAGDAKDLVVPFPEDYQAKDLAGKEATFKINVKKIQEKAKVRIDKKLAEKMLPGVEGADVDMLNEKVEEQMMSEELSKLYNEDLKPKLTAALLKKYKFDIPTFIIEQEMDNKLNQKASTMSEDEINAIKDDAEKVKAMREEFRDEASESVKATFVIDALAQAENVVVTEDEVSQTIFYEAMQSGQDPQATLDHYKKSGYLPAVQMAMVEDRVLSKLLDSAVKEA
jgi:trigger factor